MQNIFSNRCRKRSPNRLVVGVFCCLALLACRSGPLDDYSLEAVHLRSAPKLDFLRSRAGMKFLQVVFEFENRSGDDLTLHALDFSLRDTTGRLYPFSAQVLDMGQRKGTAEALLEAGQRRSGSVVFQIPAQADPGALIYKQDVEGGLVVMLLSAD